MSEDFWNQFAGVILGAEENEDPNSNSNEEEDPEDEGDPDEEGDKGDKGDGESGKTEDDFAKLQKTLEAERRITKRQDRELKRLRASQDAKKSEQQEEEQQTRAEVEAEKAKTQKLAAGLLRRDIDAAIKEAAKDAKFLDVEDALNGVDRSKIVFEQDDEDPTDIFVDEATVKAAVKALAAKKPHFLNRGTDDGDSTGSTFGGSKKRSKLNEEEELRAVYPGL